MPEVKRRPLVGIVLYTSADMAVANSLDTNESEWDIFSDTLVLDIPKPVRDSNLQEIREFCDRKSVGLSQLPCVLVDDGYDTYIYQLDTRDVNGSFRRLFDAAGKACGVADLRATLEGIVEQTERQVVVLIHGIRDWGSWHQTIMESLESDLITVTGPTYGYFNLFRFLAPLDFSKQPKDRVLNCIRDAQSAYPGARVSIIAHSFGSHLITSILADNPDIRVYRIILCGAVVKQDFRWAKISGQIGDEGVLDKRQYIINDCGDADKWPALAASAGWRYGNSGTDGFKDPFVTDRFHKGDHSLFFKHKFVEKYWKPFINDGCIAPGSGRQGRRIPWCVRLAQGIPINWVLLLMTLLTIGGMGVWLAAPCRTPCQNLLLQREIARLSLSDPKEENVTTVAAHGPTVIPCVFDYLDTEENNDSHVHSLKVLQRLGSAVWANDLEERLSVILRIIGDGARYTGNSRTTALLLLVKSESHLRDHQGKICQVLSAVDGGTLATGDALVEAIRAYSCQAGP